MTNTSPYCPYSIPVHEDCSSVSWVYDYINYVKKKLVDMDTLSLTKEARIYNGLKTISLTSGAGKSGQPLVKE